MDTLPVKHTAGLLESVSEHAPSIARAIASGIPGIAGAGISLIASALGVGESVNEIASEVSRNPDAAGRLRSLEAERGEAISRLELESRIAAVKDRTDAREKAKAYPDFVKRLAWTVSGMMVAALALLFIPLHLDDARKQLVSMVIGVLVSKWQTIIDFFYGSSERPYSDKSSK